MTEHEAIQAALAYLERVYSIYLTPQIAFLYENEAEWSEESKVLLGKWLVAFPPSWELPELGKPEEFTFLVDNIDGTVEMESGPGKPQT